jgi:hypothetical protein
VCNCDLLIRITSEINIKINLVKERKKRGQNVRHIMVLESSLV